MFYVEQLTNEMSRCGTRLARLRQIGPSGSQDALAGAWQQLIERCFVSFACEVR